MGKIISAAIGLVTGFIWGFLFIFSNIFPYDHIHGRYEELLPDRNPILIEEKYLYSIITWAINLKSYVMHDETDCMIAGSLENDPMPHSSLHIIWTDVANHSDYFNINNNNLLFGCGSHSSSVKVARYLQQMGVESIDCLFITMYDWDHTGGLRNILENFDVKELILEQKVVDDIRKENKQRVERVASEYSLKVSSIETGNKIYAGDAVVTKMGPVEEYNKSNTNIEKPDRCNSAVYRIASPSFSALLMSDAQIPAEKDMLASDSELESDILITGHHGVGPVNSIDFLESVSPDLTIIDPSSKGHNDSLLNSMSKLEYLENSDVLSTSLVGTVVVSTDDENYKIKTASEV